jgi:hypothetical protein
MVTAYLCGPISLGGTLPPEKIKVNVEAFNRVRLKLNPSILINDPTCLARQEDWEHYMRKTIPMLCEATFVVLLEGWEKSKGCVLEVSIAHTLGIPIVFAESLDISKT